MKVYTAGKIWHAPKFQELRDVFGYDVNARWIDLDDNNYIVKRRKDILWQICYEDVRDCDFVLLYCEDMSEEQRGALVEIGMAYAFQKPVYAVGTCKTIQPNKISDVAFTHFEGFHWLPESNLLKGFRMAEKMHLKARKALRLSA
jgi:nucleoside 2-deoxyribosyltransferase